MRDFNRSKPITIISGLALISIISGLALIWSFRKTANGGDLWATIDNDRWDIVLSPSHPETVVTILPESSNGAVEVSYDGGESPQVFSIGLEGVTAHALAHTGLAVLVATSDGVYALDESLFFRDGFEAGDTSGWTAVP